MSILSKTVAPPPDPIFGIVERFQADPNPDKISLVAGIYTDENGKVPLMRCVKVIEEQLVAEKVSHGYQMITGNPNYNSAVRSLIFGLDRDPADLARVFTVQTLGGTGALRIGADLIKTLNPTAKVVISDPSWENHRALFGAAGLEVGEYTYYDAARRDIDFQGMLEDLDKESPDTVVVLHACCHNPTGCDLLPEQWTEVIEVIKRRKLLAFLDMAYQGFDKGLEEDSAVVRAFMDAGLTFLVATSFSKSMSLYGERVGALSIVCDDAAIAARVRAKLTITIRTSYSNPPIHGAAIAAAVLGSPDMRRIWEEELDGMRLRIRNNRQALVDGLIAQGVTQDVSYITRQAGMFSYSGLSREQMERMRQEYGVYGLDSGRICVAALNPGNLEYVCKAIAGVL